MQISFDPKNMDVAEAATLLGMVIPGVVKGCKSQGDTLAEVQAGMAELIAHIWAAVGAEQEDK